MTATEYKNWGRIFSGGFPGGSGVKNPTANAGNMGSIPGWGICRGEAKDKPFQYSCLEISMDRGARQATVQRVAKELGHNSVTEQQDNILYFDFMMLVTEVHISVKTHQTVNLDGVMFYYIKLILNKVDLKNQMKHDPRSLWPSYSFMVPQSNFMLYIFL